MTKQDTEVLDFLVVGAGSAGLSFSQLLKKQGKNFAVLESHFLPGGCSSYFDRGVYSFDVGATTLSGLKPNRPLNKFIQETNLKIETRQIDPGLIYYINNSFLPRWSDHKKWVQSFCHFFQIKNANKYWDEEFQIQNQAWDLINHYTHFPSLKIPHLLSYLNPKLLNAILLLPTLNETVFDVLPNEFKTNPNIISLINEMLFITAQNDSYTTPRLLGAMGLFYPEDTSYPMGGMKNFSHSMAQGLPINYRQKAFSIKKTNGIFEVHTANKIWKAKNIVSTLPVWDFAKLLDKTLGHVISRSPEELNHLKKDCWSAFTLYLVVPKKDRNGIYYQIHFSNEEKKLFNINSFFASFSHPEDLSRAPLGEQTVTISIHSKSDIFQDFNEYRNREDYLAVKNKLLKTILHKFMDVFEYEEKDIKYITAGSPHTYQRYTNRTHGLVGGIPHHVSRFPLNCITPYTRDENIFLLGDTTFPGQGIAAVIHGSLGLNKHLFG